MRSTAGLLCLALLLAATAQADTNLGTKQIFPATDPWNRDVSADEIDPDSAALIASIGNHRPLHPDFGTVYNGAPCGIPFIVVSGNQPRVAVDPFRRGRARPLVPIETGPAGLGGHRLGGVRRP